jgi:arylsulfatase A-like enzyme
VYAVYPATARNHLAIHTGGFHLPGDGLVAAFGHEFSGPLIARGFSAAGFATAMFSTQRLDVDGLEQFQQRAAWGTLYDFGRDVKNHLSANILNSWSAKEEFTLTQIEPWLEAHRAGPFLLSYCTGATHHPYSVPRGFREPNGRADDLARYRNAIHYTDAAVGQLVAMLKARGLFENTLIAITSDHGEAFGEHPGNFTHKNAIYEENIRSFLVVSHPALGATIAGKRIGSSGDIYATLTALAGFAVKTPGIDLTARDFPARTVYFSKGAFPEQWGLRDGKWKFIQTIRERKAELYDLAADPAERTNLADANAALVAKFTLQCERWYLQTQAACVSQFSGYAPPAK